MFDSSVISLVERIKDLFDSKGLFLALAESCTGGLIGGAVTEVPGVSSFFWVALGHTPTVPRSPYYRFHPRC